MSRALRPWSTVQTGIHRLESSTLVDPCGLDTRALGGSAAQTHRARVRQQRSRGRLRRRPSPPRQRAARPWAPRPAPFARPPAPAGAGRGSVPAQQSSENNIKLSRTACSYPATTRKLIWTSVQHSSTGTHLVLKLSGTGCCNSCPAATNAPHRAAAVLQLYTCQQAAAAKQCWPPAARQAVGYMQLHYAHCALRHLQRGLQ